MSRVAVVTGAAGGVGSATCDVLEAQGWSVIAIDRRPVDREGALQIDLADAPSVMEVLGRCKRVDALGKFPLPIEVIPMARSYVAREIVRRGGQPVWRESVVTDNGNWIIDVHGWQIVDPVAMERDLNQIPGIVTVGLFAQRSADIVLIGEHEM